MTSVKQQLFDIYKTICQNVERKQLNIILYIICVKFML